LNDSDYYIGSNSSFGIAIILPPPEQPNILEMITIFPYNIMVVATATVLVGAAVLLIRKRRSSLGLEEGRKKDEPEPEYPSSYDNYKDGIVKLFNYFFAYSKWKFDGIEDSMTPREFQFLILKKVSPKGTNALEYLVTAFEIADYSTSKPSKGEFDKCVAAVKQIKELIDHE
jgi:hypothetical protein